MGGNSWPHLEMLPGIEKGDLCTHDRCPTTDPQLLTQKGYQRSDLEPDLIWNLGTFLVWSLLAGEKKLQQNCFDRFWSALVFKLAQRKSPHQMKPMVFATKTTEENCVREQPRSGARKGSWDGFNHLDKKKINCFLFCSSTWYFYLNCQSVTRSIFLSFFPPFHLVLTEL